tara:strand:+ start:57 stop:446 length:390 start_codon:yes stop_codon:yes gene_type:complete
MTTTTRGNLALFAWILSLGLVIGCVYWQLTHGLSLEEWLMMIGAFVIFVGSFIIYIQDKRNARRTYCVATCHRGSEFGVFLSGPEDERLTLEEAKATASAHGKGYYLFECIPEVYWKEEDELYEKGEIG